MENKLIEIPVNCRVVGKINEKINLYFEDYVYTFIKKNLEIGINCVSIFGEIERNGDNIKCIINAASAIYDENEFYKNNLIGKAFIDEDLKKMRIQTQDGDEIIAEGFYVFYSCNEEMQNYLIKWNVENNTISKEERDRTAIYSKIINTCNKEEIKVGMLWNYINIVCLSIVVCILACGIIVLNGYKKMKNLEDDMEYVLATVNNLSYMEMKDEGIENELVSEEPSAKNEYNDQDKKVETEVKEDRVYIVKEGDTLYSICIQFYGDVEKIKDVCEINKIENPNSILCGQKLLLP